ncbi:hypothetical protein NL532_24080 [Mesorhizobium sp. C120A]|uniref:hypothetical protein n=1 Tax=unclassified Mesorhizobium TaxID=325217 RepID=UPI0003CFD8E6|nr:MULTISPECIES: hypothetical protein [unclassified Mesorhizobium]ESZ60653.1 hypothetical protein X728_15035 [Mesorhizobium sp. L103C120A0]WJI43688.1 hypothetical protein NL532_24080 [Mesorhizobium sp. C120A]
MHGGHVKFGTVVGLGAALNVPLGFVPRLVELYNMTDGDIITSAFLQWVIPFSSGGTNVISAGDKIKGATSGATAVVEEVLIASGTFAAGTAAGFFTVQEGSLVGTFQSENVYDLTTQAASGIDDATVTVNVVHNIAVTTAAAGATTTSAISRLEGTAGSSGSGFTIGSVIAEAAKCLRWVAYQGD